MHAYADGSVIPSTESVLLEPRPLSESVVQILEVRAGDGQRPVTITAAISADAVRAICVALSEELDRHLQDPTEDAENVLVLREQAALVARLKPTTAAGAHDVVCFSHAELRTCLLELARYVERVDDEHYQPPELRARLQTIKRMTPVLWEANTAAAAAPTAIPKAPVRDGTE